MLAHEPDLQRYAMVRATVHQRVADVVDSAGDLRQGLCQGRLLYDGGNLAALRRDCSTERFALGS